jgi:hypothetical protein
LQSVAIDLRMILRDEPIPFDAQEVNDRARLSRGEALLAVVLNAGWVAGSVAVMEVGSLTRVGNWAVAAVAAAVLVFAVLESVGLRRLREATI